MAKPKRIKITGMKEVNRNLRQLSRKMEKNVPPALAEVVSFVQKESMKRTPIDFGTLHASHRSKVEGTGKKARGIVYLLAAYALFVHFARKTVKFKSQWPRGRLFLERAITDNLKPIGKIIQKWMKVNNG